MTFALWLLLSQASADPCYHPGGRPRFCLPPVTQLAGMAASCPQACGPTVHHAGRENMHLTGICFLLASPFQQVKRIPAALQGECLGPLSPLRNLHTSDRGLPWGREYSYQSG